MYVERGITVLTMKERKTTKNGADFSCNGKVATHYGGSKLSVYRDLLNNATHKLLRFCGFSEFPM